MLELARHHQKQLLDNQPIDDAADQNTDDLLADGQNMSGISSYMRNYIKHIQSGASHSGDGHMAQSHHHQQQHLEQQRQNYHLPSVEEVASIAITTSKTIQTRRLKKSDTIAVYLYQSHYMHPSPMLSTTIAALLRSRPPGVLSRGLRLLEIALTSSPAALSSSANSPPPSSPDRNTLSYLIVKSAQNMLKRKQHSAANTGSLTSDQHRHNYQGSDSMDEPADAQQDVDLTITNLPQKPLQQKMVPIAIKLRKGLTFDSTSNNNSMLINLFILHLCLLIHI